MKKKFYNTEKTERGTLWDCSTSILSQSIKKLKSHNVKKLKGGPFSLCRYCMLRGKRGKTILVQIARPNDSIWDHNILWNFFRSILASWCGLKKSHYNSRASLHEAPTKKNEPNRWNI